MELGIRGKRALVTGASGGLGQAAAIALAHEGVEVIINSRSQERLAESATQIAKATGQRPKYFAADISNRDQVAKLLQQAGPIDILVSNTGGPPPGRPMELDAEKWEHAGKLILESAIVLTHGVLPHMIERKWGRLIYITSISALQPIDDLTLSNVYRSGVAAFSKTISNNHAQDGITANCVCPGYIGTARLQSLAEKRAQAAGKSVKEMFDEFAAGNPMKRIGKPEELAAAIAFLASNQAAYISGSAIAVDGGARKALF